MDKLSKKDLLKNSLARGPVSAHQKLIPVLNQAELNNNGPSTISGTSNNDIVPSKPIENDSQNNVEATEAEHSEGLSSLKTNQDLEVQVESLQERLLATGKQLDMKISEMENTSTQLSDALQANEALKSEITLLSQECDILRARLSSLEQERLHDANEADILHKYAVSRMTKQIGQKKGETYKRDGFYHDHDIHARLETFLGQQDPSKRFDKSTVINAAIDRLLKTLGY